MTKRFRFAIIDNVKIVLDGKEYLSDKEALDMMNALHEENQRLKKLNIPIDEIKDTVSDYRGRIIGVYYND